ncbi:DNRLRE domain-containing protein [Clostridium tetani]|uniref:DNRLRE domain-containing protein n=1 Tax=Clostridium tetani TaxID=1513 RepID=UPI002953109B|nr:DNRLRE domain-containing protein [Clostridium tetani]
MRYGLSISRGDIMNIKKIYATNSTYILSHSPNTNYHNENNLEVCNNSIGQAVSYIRFNLKDLPLNANIISANLNIYLWYEEDSNVDYGIKLGNTSIYNSDFEKTATWSNTPEWKRRPSSSWGTRTVKGIGWKKLNAKHLVSSLQSGQNVIILCTDYKNNDNGKIFYSSNHLKKPYITIEYEVPININLSIKVDKKKCDYENGWVKVDGQLREIDKVWTKINGVLREGQ